MNRYQLLKQIPNTAQLIASGILPISMSVRLQVYERYLDLKRIEKKNSQAIQKTADYFDLSDVQVYKVVAFMEN